MQQRTFCFFLESYHLFQRCYPQAKTSFISTSWEKNGFSIKLLRRLCFSMKNLFSKCSTLLIRFEMLFDDIPSAISRSDSAKANLAVNRSKVFNVLSLALGEAPSIAALMAWISSANEEDCEDLFLWWSPGDSIPTKKKNINRSRSWSSWTQIRISWREAYFDLVCLKKETRLTKDLIWSILDEEVDREGTFWIHNFFDGNYFHLKMKKVEALKIQVVGELCHPAKEEKKLNWRIFFSVFGHHLQGIFKSTFEGHILAATAFPIQWAFLPIIDLHFELVGAISKWLCFRAFYLDWWRH